MLYTLRATCVVVLVIILTAQLMSQICNAACTTGDIRLGLPYDSIHIKGRVEICYNNSWGTVCDSSSHAWSTNDISVACRQLGYSYTGTSSTSISWPVSAEYTNLIVLDEPQCTGTESRLIDCPHRGFGNHVGQRCLSDNRWPSVVCSPGCPQNGAIRLRDGANSLEGRIEICYNNAWGTVCGPSLSTNGATVACRQLGIGDFGAIPRSSRSIRDGSGQIVLKNLQCTGTESRLIDCRHDGLGNNRSCSHSDDVGVRCTGCRHGVVRLRDGTKTDGYEGLIEVCYYNSWGTVCDNLWSTEDANVVCRQLGLGSTGAVPRNWIDGTGPIVFAQIRCTGNELNLSDCPRNGLGLGVYNCSHSHDAGVICAGCSEGALRVRDGATMFEGRLEICYKKEWCTICSDFYTRSSSSYDIAKVVCRQLGFSSSGAVPLSPEGVVDGSGRIVSSGLPCDGNEARLVDCRSSGLNYSPNCVHAWDVGVRCVPHSNIVCREGDVRLRNGDNDLEGRVEFCHNNEWGSVCDHGWEKADAVVVCRQLGFPTIGAVGLTGRTFPVAEKTLVWLDGVDCSGKESRLAECPANPIGITYSCGRYIAAGVRCAGLSGAQIFGIVFGSLVVVCCGACCLCLLIGFICHKKLKNKSATRSTHRSFQLSPASQSHNNITISHPYTAPQELSTTDISHSYQSPIARLKEADAEPSAPPLEAAVTHAGEAPPAYHTVVQYKTVDLNTHEDVQLSGACTQTESVSPPVYKETL